MNTGIYLLHEGFTVLVIFPVLFMQNRMNQLEQTVTASLQLILEPWCIQLNQWEVVIVVFFHRRCYYVGIARERLEWYSPRDKHRSRRPAKNDVILEKIISQSSIWQSSFFWSLFWNIFYCYNTYVREQKHHYFLEIQKYSIHIWLPFQCNDAMFQLLKAHQGLGTLGKAQVQCCDSSPC